MIKKPILAETVVSLESVVFPVLATPKLDGIRCLKVDGKALTRSLKPIPNKYIREYIETNCLDGFDGEIIIPNQSFNSTQSLVMTREGTPRFQYVVFDFVLDDNQKPYIDRISDLVAIPSVANISYLVPVEINTLSELISYEEKCISEGYEGIMLRTKTSPYKFGRSTKKEAYLLKFKRFHDSEAIILDFEEQDSINKGNTLGMIYVQDVKTNVRFGVGTGFDDSMRDYIWKNKSSLKGRIITYTFQESGAKLKPRFPVFKGFRDAKDIS